MTRFVETLRKRKHAEERRTMNGAPEWRRDEDGRPLGLFITNSGLLGIYGTIVTRRLGAMGIRDKPTAPASPWQNCFAERLIGSIRRECVDHFVVLDAWLRDD